MTATFPNDGEPLSQQPRKRRSRVSEKQDDTVESTQEPSADRSTQADLLVELACDVEKFHDFDRKAYASFESGGHRETSSIDSVHFSNWLAHRYYQAHGRAVSPKAMGAALEQLKAVAVFDGRTKLVHLRVAKEGDDLWLDLADPDCQAIKITKAGWSLEANPAVKFIRKQGMMPLPIPERSSGGNLDKLFRLFHVRERGEQLLLTAWLVNVLNVSSSYPILVLIGEQGSGKTTLARALLRLVDPNYMETRSPPRSEEDIAVAAQHGRIISYENLSAITQNISDALCRVATGAAFGARKLYSDADERQLKFCRPLLLNGIGDLATRSDLADRCITLSRPPIAAEQRQTEKQLWDEFERLRPKVLGELLDLAVAVHAMPDLDIPLERMAEFTLIGAKVALAMELPASIFLDAYTANRGSASLAALEASAVASALRRRLTKGPLHCTMSEVLKELNRESTPAERRTPAWPDNPRSLSSELDRLAPNLRRVGVNIGPKAHTRTGNVVCITLWNDADNVH